MRTHEKTNSEAADTHVNDLRFVTLARFTSGVAKVAGRPGGVSGYPRAWYRSVS